ncbi:DUF397 domain-containing protein [Streptomyces sp. NPDC001407]|uniref:DUF397 domain-containing protein n=1 Tax=unclassified Streptomyces TaxID=2593676 RepID=UPI0034048B63
MRTTRPDLTASVWRKSSYSGGGEDACVEIAPRQFPGIVPIRDSKNPHGPVIAPPTAAWSAFVTAVAAANGNLAP